MLGVTTQAIRQQTAGPRAAPLLTRINFDGRGPQAGYPNINNTLQKTLEMAIACLSKKLGFTTMGAPWVSRPPANKNVVHAPYLTSCLHLKQIYVLMLDCVSWLCSTISCVDDVFLLTSPRHKEGSASQACPHGPRPHGSRGSARIPHGAVWPFWV